MSEKFQDIAFVNRLNTDGLSFQRGGTNHPKRKSTVDRFLDPVKIQIESGGTDHRTHKRYQK